MNSEARRCGVESRIPSPPKKHYFTQSHKGHKALHTHHFLLGFFTTYYSLLPTHYYLNPKSKILNPNLSFCFLIFDISFAIWLLQKRKFIGDFPLCKLKDALEFFSDYGKLTIGNIYPYTPCSFSYTFITVNEKSDNPFF